jgi:hypothetical protein
VPESASLHVPRDRLPPGIAYFATGVLVVVVWVALYVAYRLIRAALS